MIGRDRPRCVVGSGSLLACLLGVLPVRAQQAASTEPEDELEFEAVAEVEAPPREPTKRTLEQEQLTTVPGTRGDALRAIEVMPGVARTQFATNPGPPSLRGSPPSESLVLLDGAQMPLLYHFGGLTSVFNSQLLESVSLYPGNFSARYGRAAGGAVEVRARDPRSDGLHAQVEISAIDSYALAETPLSARSGIALAARRSSIDPFIDLMIDDDVRADPTRQRVVAGVGLRIDERDQIEAPQVEILEWNQIDAQDVDHGAVFCATDDPGQGDESDHAGHRNRMAQAPDQPETAHQRQGQAEQDDGYIAKPAKHHPDDQEDDRQRRGRRAH